MTDRLKVGVEIGVASRLNVTFTQMARYGFAQSRKNHNSKPGGVAIVGDAWLLRF